MDAHATGDYWETRGLALLWFSVLSAPVAWALLQLISYASVKPVCFANATFTLTAMSAGALVLVTAGALVGRACLLRSRDGIEEGGRRVDRSHFMALVGIGFNILVALLIVFATFPQFVLSPCE